MLTEKDYCDYETCVALKELGYNQYHSHRIYAGEGGVWIPNFEGEPNYNEGELILHEDLFDVPRYGNEVAAPLLYEAQKYLREDKNIHIEVYACAGGYIYELCKAYKPNSFSGGTTIYTPNDVDNPKLNDAGRYDDFETCLFEGIKQSVKILKEER